MTPLALAALAIFAAGDPPKAGEPKGGRPMIDPFRQPPTLADLVEQYTRNHKRVNGTMLRIKADTAPRDEGGPVVRVRWELDYTGPRPPLIILAPSLQRPTGATTVSVIYGDFSGVGRQVNFWSGTPHGLWRPAESDFVTAKPGEVAAGVIDVPVKRVEEKIGRTLQAGDVVYVRITHEARLRGDHLAGHRKGEKALDAWTGTLYSNPVKITITKSGLTSGN